MSSIPYHALCSAVEFYGPPKRMCESLCEDGEQPWVDAVVSISSLWAQSDGVLSQYVVKLVGEVPDPYLTSMRMYPDRPVVVEACPLLRHDRCMDLHLLDLQEDLVFANENNQNDALDLTCLDAGNIRVLDVRRWNVDSQGLATFGKTATQLRSLAVACPLNELNALQEFERLVHLCVLQGRETTPARWREAGGLCRGAIFGRDVPPPPTRRHHRSAVHPVVPTEAFPTILGKLPHLKSLDLRNCGVSDVSPLSNLLCLEELNVSGCAKIASLAPLAPLGHLIEVEASGCSRLVDLPVLVTLRRLSLDGTVAGAEQRFTGFPNLELLDLRAATHESDLAPLSATCHTLQTLSLHMSATIRSLEDLFPMAELRFLDLSGLPHLRDMSSLANQPNLVELNLSRCSSLRDVAPLPKIPSLRKVSLSHCAGLGSDTQLHMMTQVRELVLVSCGNLGDLEQLGMLSELQVLDISDNNWVADLTPISRLPKLQKFAARKCSTKVIPVFRSKFLSELDLHKCSLIGDISALSEVSSLKSVDVGGTGVSGVMPLSRLFHLRRLCLSHCRLLRSLAGLECVRRLEILDLAGCDYLKDVSIIPTLSALATLDVTGCTSISELSWLSWLSSTCQVIGPDAPITADTRRPHRTHVNPFSL